MTATQRDDYRRAAEHIGNARRELVAALEIAQGAGLTLVRSLERVVGALDRLLYRFNRRASRG